MQSMVDGLWAPSNDPRRHIGDTGPHRIDDTEHTAAFFLTLWLHGLLCTRPVFFPQQQSQSTWNHGTLGLTDHDDQYHQQHLDLPRTLWTCLSVGGCLDSVVRVERHS